MRHFEVNGQYTAKRREHVCILRREGGPFRGFSSRERKANKLALYQTKLTGVTDIHQVQEVEKTSWKNIPAPAPRCSIMQAVRQYWSQGGLWGARHLAAWKKSCWPRCASSFHRSCTAFSDIRVIGTNVDDAVEVISWWSQDDRVEKHCHVRQLELTLYCRCFHSFGGRNQQRGARYIQDHTTLHLDPAGAEASENTRCRCLSGQHWYA